MPEKKNLYRIKGKLQHYPWGGHEYLPSLLNQENAQHQPFAEYWLGVHTSGPALLPSADNADLDTFIQADPSLLGNQVRFKFGTVPYLMKILDVREMLSIQVHPNKAAAEAAFEAENAAGVPLSASNRNYKDANHKPELMYALGDFWLLHGFKEPDQLKSTLTAIKELAFLDAVFDRSGYEGVYQLVMEMDQEKVNRHLKSLLDRIIPEYQEKQLSKSSPHFWAARAALTYNQGSKIDRGIFSIYLLNLVHLSEGEAIFQDAGILHAYLEGQNVEIMANSDNVLRGGLTPKHIDVSELMKHVSFKPIRPAVIRGEKKSDTETVYPTPAVDFELSRIRVPAGAEAIISATTAEIAILLTGAANITSGGEAELFKKGDAFVMFAGTSCTVAAAVNTEIFKASVPIESGE